MRDPLRPKTHTTAALLVAVWLGLGVLSAFAAACSSETTIIKKKKDSAGAENTEEDIGEEPIDEDVPPRTGDGSGGDEDVSVQDSGSPAETEPQDADTSPADTEPGKPECPFGGGWACPCTTNSDCVAEFCVQSDKGKICTEKCFDDSSCEKGWGCVQISGTGMDLTYVCVPKFVTLCRPCATNADCSAPGMPANANVCVPFGTEDKNNGSFCGTKCALDKDCPDGFACSQVTTEGTTVSQCLPKNGADCSCTPLFKGRGDKTACFKKNEYGTCNGTRTCTQQGLTACTAIDPEPESCDGDDNDCDGQTDEVGSAGCTAWYPDNDNDTYGIGAGQCLCSAPGGDYADAGGDCNDLASNVNPGAAEVCNNVDDNCNGETDEVGAGGCTIFYHDKDKDTFGDPNDTACLCPPAPAGWVAQAGDCDDTKFEVKSGGLEMCNGADDNCNGKTDEENAQGCALYYPDDDSDGYGPTATGKCLCGPNAAYKVDKPGDCDDLNKDVHPLATEICNGVDDDCNNKTDDGAATASCPAVANGAAACKDAACAVGTCVAGFFDVNTQYGDGCECAGDPEESKGGQTCESAVDLGTLADGGGTVQVGGNVAPATDSDWYRFTGKDIDDFTQGGCDKYHVRARFLFNPGDQFVLDLYRGGCAGINQVCTGEVDISWRTNYYGAPEGAGIGKGAPYGCPGGPEGKACKGSPTPLPAGECPCTAAPGSPGVNHCTDNTAGYWVRIYRKAGVAPTCDNYAVEISNGVY
jgi:hypothetical protein